MALTIIETTQNRTRLKAAIARIRKHRHGSHTAIETRVNAPFDGGRFNAVRQRLHKHVRQASDRYGSHTAITPRVIAPFDSARFNSARQRIREQVLDEFRKHEWPLLKKLDVVFENSLGLPVPTLSVCGAGTAEVRFTKLLAYFFDSRNHHGLAGLLVQAVFADAIDDGECPFETCTAEAEVELGSSGLPNSEDKQNVLDVLIQVGDHRIAVEHKINSAEGRNQRCRYFAALEKRFSSVSTNHLHCFYLTPNGRDVSLQKKGNWRTLSHRDLFKRMASVIDRDTLSSSARHNLRALMWDLMLGPMAQNRRWMREFAAHVHHVAQEYQRYTGLKRWLERKDLGLDELRILLRIIGD